MAYWLMIHAAVLARVVIFFKERKGITTDTYELELDLEDMRAAADAFNQEKADDALVVELVPQLHGCMVEVPVGWAHAVYNVQSCVKVAFDLFDASQFVGCVYAWRRMRCRDLQFDRRSAEDYQAVMGVLQNAVVQWMS